MACYKARVDPNQYEDPHHVRVRVFVGVDPEHYQSAGVIILESDQVEEFLSLINDRLNEPKPVPMTMDERFQSERDWDARVAKGKQ